MKEFGAFGKTTVMTAAAGALCAALLAGCGGATTMPMTDPASAQSLSMAQEPMASIDESGSTDTLLLEDYAAEGYSSESELMASAENYPNLTSFTAKTIDGKTFTQDDLAKADATLINFWSVYCPYCLEEMPNIAAWAKTLPGNVQVVTVCTDYDSDLESAKDVLEEAGLTCPTLVYGTGDFEDLMSNVAFLPTTLVVDRTGKVVGNVLEGAPQDLSATYSQMVNSVLKAQGKA